ncbi:hypothetical protein VZ94_13800 [Methylocucumis oryzae]|uniref:Ketosynthase family 3 (KS3) domain-containing protein n=2 Tax=Methylocucumis oryzae TaxID=1632867 RepID=A0A0F3IHR2_9GAMM|nr:hypothetical protein VZ94_13800 [Methylocucumis oryzae]
MSGCVPGADDIDAFWQLLLSGQDGVSELPPEFTGTRRGGLINGKDAFDALFFVLSPLEANAMHPHQRLVLEHGYLALLDAGINPKRLAGEPAGVFIGAEPTGFFQDSFTGASEAIIASRLAYFLNLKRPGVSREYGLFLVGGGDTFSLCEFA